MQGGGKPTPDVRIALVWRQHHVGTSDVPAAGALVVEAANDSRIAGVLLPTTTGVLRFTASTLPITYGDAGAVRRNSTYLIDPSGCSGRATAVTLAPVPKNACPAYAGQDCIACLLAMDVKSVRALGDGVSGVEVRSNPLCSTSLRTLCTHHGGACWLQYCMFLETTPASVRMRYLAAARRTWALQLPVTIWAATQHVCTSRAGSFLVAVAIRNWHPDEPPLNNELISMGSFFVHSFAGGNQYAAGAGQLVLAKGVPLVPLAPRLFGRPREVEELRKRSVPRFFVQRDEHSKATPIHLRWEDDPTSGRRRFHVGLDTLFGRSVRFGREAYVVVEKFSPDEFALVAAQVVECLCLGLPVPFLDLPSPLS